MDVFDEHIMEPSNETIQEIKKILEEQHGREFSWEEATKAAWDMQMFAQLALKVGKEEWERQKKLKEFPKGYELEAPGNCHICGKPVSGEKAWYDKYGIKCMTCQAAIDKKIIPGSLAKNKESWYSNYDLENYFNIKGADLNKYIKQGILKNRIIPGVGKKVHLQLFLIKDNKDTLPPKRLLKSRTIKVMRNDEEYYTSENWYEFLDEKLAKKMSKYKIVECLKESFAKPITGGGRFYYKGINPLFGPVKFN